MAGNKGVVRAKALRRSLELTTEAMDLLDAYGADPEASAYLAMAQQRIRHSLAVFLKAADTSHQNRE